MHRFSYAEILDDTPHTARERESMAIQHSIDMLKAAEEQGPASREAIEALHFTRKLWAFFIEDLAKPDNGLPRQLRADLISIGLWIMREVEEIRLGNSSNFRGLKEVSELISGGLR
jgi:flagellar protein FlaF